MLNIKLDLSLSELKEIQKALFNYELTHGVETDVIQEKFINAHASALDNVTNKSRVLIND